VLITGTGTGIGGYGSELERTMIIGTPTNRQRRYVELMLEARQFAFDAIRRPACCCEVDPAVAEHDTQDRKSVV
jgi:Xaa-Pro dipeptidase